jgi:hypothetical protein
VGNRAKIIFTGGKEEFSPAIYRDWNGGAEMAEPIESSRDQSGALELGQVSPSPLAEAPCERIYKCGSAGEEIGDEPYAVIFHSDAPGRYGLATNVEGDWTEEIYATQEERDAATDEQAFWYWKTQEQAWAEGIETVAELPAEYRGPAGINLHDQPSLPVEVNGERRGMPFLPKRKLLDQIPALDGQTLNDDGISDRSRADYVVHAHYFGGTYDFYLCEIDLEKDMAYGILHVARGERKGTYWGHNILSELEKFSYRQPISVNGADPSVYLAPLERDLYWERQTAGELGLVPAIDGSEVGL